MEGKYGQALCLRDEPFGGYVRLGKRGGCRQIAKRGAFRRRHAHARRRIRRILDGWAHLHQRLARQLGVAEKPLELAELGAAPLSNWLLSAEGSNVDILGAAERLACEEPRQLAILCGRPGSPLADIGSSHQFIALCLYPPPSGKDGFLATNSLFGFAALLARSYIEEFHDQEEWKAVGSIVEPLLRMDSAETESWMAGTESLWSRHTILALHDANTRIGAIDLESKFSEAALGNLQVADYRNFAHGRHHWLAKRGDDSSVLALFSPSGADLANRTLALLPKNIPASRVALLDGPTAGMLGSLVAALKITGWAGHARGIDPGNPGVPEFGRKIYHLPLRRSAKKTMAGLSSGVLGSLNIKSKANFLHRPCLQGRNEFDHWRRILLANMNRQMMRELTPLLRTLS